MNTKAAGAVLDQPAVVDNGDVVEVREDYVVFQKGTDEKTKKPEYDYASAKSFEKLVKENKVSADDEEFRVTASFPKPKNYAGIATICPDEEVAAAIFYSGARTKGTNRFSAMILETDDNGKLQFPDSKLFGNVVDLTGEIASPPKRTSKTADEKLDDFLDSLNVPAAVKEQLRTTYKAAMASGASIPGLTEQPAAGV